MDRKYRKELIELKTKPTEQINGIYIIPYKEYNGFWGKTGYKSFDFIFENNKGEKNRLVSLGRRCNSPSK